MDVAGFIQIEKGQAKD